MNKPLSVAYEEFKQNMLNIINNAGLPAFIVENVLQNYLIEIKAIAKQQYQSDRTEYEQSLMTKEG